MKKLFKIVGIVIAILIVLVLGSAVFLTIIEVSDEEVCAHIEELATKESGSEIVISPLGTQEECEMNLTFSTAESNPFTKTFQFRCMNNATSLEEVVDCLE